MGGAPANKFAVHMFVLPSRPRKKKKEARTGERLFYFPLGDLARGVEDNKPKYNRLSSLYQGVEGVQDDPLAVAITSSNHASSTDRFVDARRFIDSLFHWKASRVSLHRQTLRRFVEHNPA
ncbi:unnamed protein product, partial [Ixodes persulcatus]